MMKPSSRCMPHPVTRLAKSFVVLLGALTFSLTATPGMARAQSATADTSKYTFAGMPWGSTSSAVKAALQQNGYEFVTVDKDGDYNFKGTVLGYPAHVYVFMDPKGRATKVMVVLKTPSSDATSVYQRMLGLLIEKYGDPDKSLAFFESPYYDGDGYEEQAIAIGKGHFIAMWGYSKGDSNNDLAIMIDKDLDVTIGYESYGWHAEAQRRQALSTNAF